MPARRAIDRKFDVDRNDRNTASEGILPLLLSELGVESKTGPNDHASRARGKNDPKAARNFETVLMAGSDAPR